MTEETEEEVEMEEEQGDYMEKAQCCEDGSCGCEFDAQEEVEELRDEVETLRTEVDYLVDRMNVGNLIDYEE